MDAHRVTLGSLALAEAELWRLAAAQHAPGAQSARSTPPHAAPR